MSGETMIARIAALISLCAAYFAWITAHRSNQINKISALVVLRQHYFGMFRQEAAVERYRGMPSAVRSAAKSAGIMADRLRVIDKKLAEHYERVIRDANA